MVCSYAYIISNNHHLVKVNDGNYVIDTGSFVSFSLRSDINEVEINGIRFLLPQNPLGLNLQRIEDLVQCEVAGFIGLDILKQLNSIILNKRESKVFFGTSIDDVSNQIEMVDNKLFYGITAIINGKTVKTLFDTGAQIGYMSQSIAAGLKAVGTISDYNPSLGEIKTEKYETEVQYRNVSWKGEIATFTPMLQLQLGLIGVEAIIGLNNIDYQVLKLDFENKIIEIEEKTEKVMTRKDFEDYYYHEFPGDLQTFYSSYVKNVEPNNSFLGFKGVEHLRHIDVIWARTGIKKHQLELVSIDKRDMFFLSLSIMAATDICIYSFYPEVKGIWYQMSQYPKITGWNYYAEEPAYHLAKLVDLNKIVFLRDLCRETALELKHILHISDKEDLSIEEIIWKLLAESKSVNFDAECFLKP